MQYYISVSQDSNLNRLLLKAIMFTITPPTHVFVGDGGLFGGGFFKKKIFRIITKKGGREEMGRLREDSRHNVFKMCGLKKDLFKDEGGYLCYCFDLWMLSLMM